MQTWQKIPIVNDIILFTSKEQLCLSENIF